MTRKIFIRVESIEDMNRHIDEDVEQLRREDRSVEGPTLGFASIGQYRSLLSPQRDRLLRVLRANEPRSIYHLAKILGRPQSAVHQDVTLLTRWGFIGLTRSVENGRTVLRPFALFDEIHFVRDYRPSARPVTAKPAKGQPRTIAARGDAARARPKRDAAVASAIESRFPKNRRLSKRIEALKARSRA